MQLIQDRGETLDMFLGRSSTLQLIQDRGKTLDMFLGRSSTLQLIQDSRVLMGSLIERPSFASMTGADKPFPQFARQPAFASMIGTGVIPRAEWSAVLGQLRGQIGDDLYHDAVAEFSVAADATDNGDAADAWWAFRLPAVLQLALLALVFQVLDRAGEFMADLAGGDDLPPAFRSGTELLLALVVVLLAAIEAKAETDADIPSDDAGDERDESGSK